MIELVPINFDEAQAFVKKHHRHHIPPVGHKFSIAAAIGETVVGVVIVGRPVARRLDNGFTLEVTRLCTDGTKNACSFLYSAAWRVAKNLGYRRLITYILQSETGTSLAAAGWKALYETPGKSWSVKSRPRVDKHPLQVKILYEAPQ
jgi:hypothetical protein